MSSDTKKALKWKKITFWISVMLNLVPMIVFVIMGFVNGDVKEKVAIGFTTLSAIILTLFMILSKVNMKRTVFWIVLFGVVGVMDSLYTLFLVMGICQMLDDLVVSPLHTAFKNTAKTNKIIDKRLKDAGIKSGI